MIVIVIVIMTIITSNRNSNSLGTMEIAWQILVLLSGKDQGGPSKGGFLNNMIFS